MQSWLYVTMSFGIKRSVMRFLQSMLTALVSTPLRITKRGIRELNDVGRDAESALDAVMSANGEV